MEEEDGYREVYEARLRLLGRGHRDTLAVLGKLISCMADRVADAGQLGCLLQPSGGTEIAALIADAAESAAAAELAYHPTALGYR